MIYHVSVSGCDNATGSQSAPFRTINRAAQVARPGDTVQVHSGTYREWVKPQYGGTDDNNRIVYEAAPGEHPVIKGSEVVENWEKTEGTVWKKTVPNDLFGEWNPYAKKIEGDWLVAPRGYDVHLGDVYINGVSMYEASSMEDLYRAEIRLSGWQVHQEEPPELIRHPELTAYRWFAEVAENTTTLYGNFQDIDPNEALIEINVRKCCFYPVKTGLNYITVRGFEMAHAACPFTPPTADQVGMLGANWSIGWIIENNRLHDAKCSAVSIGKEASTGDNDCHYFRKKHSHYYQTEAVFRALHQGWSKQTVGSHTVRNNVIYDCGQNGIVGHLGCVFSTIEHNHIYNIAVKHEFFGYEIGGIKLHAAIDVVIKDNNIHDCTMGVWLDWQAQGARVTGNLFYHNERDLMIEVTHGPCLVDNNLLLSEVNLDYMAQGGAFVHNLFAGGMKKYTVPERETPYHFAHSTEVLGITSVPGGDDRLYNNIMLGAYPVPTHEHKQFCSCFNEYALYEDFRKNMENNIPLRPVLPVWINENAYAGYASPFRAEQRFFRVDGMTVSVEEEGNEWFVTLNVPATVAIAQCTPVTTERLGKTVYAEAGFENPDATPVDFTRDLIGAKRAESVLPGPFAHLVPGIQKISVWKSTATK